MSSSSLQRTHDIMSTLAGLADEMHMALRKSDLDKIARLKAENVSLRTELTEAKQSLTGFRPSSEVEVRLLQSLRPLAQRIAKADDRFKFWMQDFQTIRCHGERTVGNALENTGQLREARSAEKLAGIVKGRPAVIVSAGPSLDKQWEHLQKYRDRFVLITMNRCVDALIEHDLVPDFVVVTDPKEAIRHHLTQVTPETVPNLLIRVSAHPLVWQANAGNKYYFTDGSKHEVGLLESIKCDTPMRLSGMSAAHGCLRLSKHIGCSLAILVGQDLAYTDDRMYSASDRDEITIKPIADGSVAVCEGNKLGEESGGNATLLMKVPGYYGEDVVTDPGMNKMIQYFESIIAESFQGYRVLNATEGGARIEGTEQIPFKQALDEHCSEPFTPYYTRTLTESADSEAHPNELGDLPIRQLLEKVTQVYRLTTHSIKALKHEPTSNSYLNKLLRKCDQVYEAYNKVSFLLGSIMLQKKMEQNDNSTEVLKGVAKTRAEHIAIRYAARQAMTLLKKSLGEAS